MNMSNISEMPQTGIKCTKRHMHSEVYVMHKCSVYATIYLVFTGPYTVFYIHDLVYIISFCALFVWAQGIALTGIGPMFTENISIYFDLSTKMIQTSWRHQMETFSALLAICAGNSPIPGECPAQRLVMRSFDIFSDFRLSKQSWGWLFETLSGPLWCHCYGCHRGLIIVSNIQSGRQLKRSEDFITFLRKDVADNGWTWMTYIMYHHK